MASTLTYSTVLSMLSCGNCSIPFAIPLDLHEKVQRDGSAFWCPNGHHISYSDTENAKLRRQLDYANGRNTHLRDQRDAAQRSASAYKGQVTKIRKRVANGVCPCCNRTFANLARHMAGQHPGYEASDA